MIRFVTVGALCCLSPRALSYEAVSTPTPAFVSEHLAELPVFAGGNTYGFGVGLAPGASPIVITHLGVYDVEGNGLNNSHEIGLWMYDTSVGDFELLRTTTLPSGTDTLLLGGYRYVSLSPLLIEPGQSFMLGALYSAVDQDGVGMKPDSVRFGQQFLTPREGSAGGDDGTLAVPLQPICRGEGLPCYDFYPVNFLFQTIPEPGAFVLMMMGLCGLLLYGRRADRSQFRNNE